MAVSPQYLAGCIDCDGCISIVRSQPSGRGKNTRYMVRVILANTDLNFLLKVQSSYGGHVKTLKRRNISWKIAHQLEWGTKDAEVVLNKIRPFLILKGDRADVALRLRELLTRGRSGGRGYVLTEDAMTARESLYLALRQLNRRGVITNGKTN